MFRGFMLAGAAVLVLAGCQERVRIPAGEQAGTCWVVSQLEGGEARFTAMPAPQPNMENCAARLEERRIHFLRMGGNRREVVGAYGDQFMFVNSAGVSLSRTLDGGRFVALRRTHDGRLAIPGAFEMEPEAAGDAPSPPPAG